MSDFHTLQELNLDAARYRGLRKMIDSGKYWLTRSDYSVAISADGVDAVIDKELARDE